MKNVRLLFLLLLLHFYPFISALKCPPDEKCLCFPGSELEFQCWVHDSEEAEFVIQINDKEILIDCASDLTQFNVDHLPNIPIDTIDNFRMRFCPLPDSFKEIFDHFGLTHVKFLQYGSSDLGNVTLTKDYFRGLEFLDSLQLNLDGIVHLDEDVFANTPNLTSLELQNNNIVLSPNLFQHTAKLKLLDLSENELQSVPEGIFRNLDRLEVLHLWSNNLTVVDDFTFKELTNLKYLELSGNTIQNVSSDAFGSLVNLSRLNLSSNKLKILLPETFSRNTKLEWILMTNNELTVPVYLMSGNVFQNSPKIKTIQLGRNKLTRLPEGFFKGLRNLEEIELNNNKLDKVGLLFASLNSLKKLTMRSNEIVQIKKDDFRDLTKLESIDLSYNKIKNIDYFAFQNTNELKKIYLAHNLYSGKNNTFTLLQNVVHVDTVDLSHNLITQISDVIVLDNKVSLKTLDLSYNRITSVPLMLIQSVAKKITINLKYNNITTVYFSSVDLITKDAKDALSGGEKSYSEIYISIENNPLNCDCFNYDLISYFQNLRLKVRVMFDIKANGELCTNLPQRRRIFTETIPQKSLTCSFEGFSQGSSCPENCSCWWRPFDDCWVLDCSNQNLTKLPDIDLSQAVTTFNQTEVHLEGNNLTSGPYRNSTGYDKVTGLFLSHNKIEKVMWLPPQLKVLHLDNNRIQHLDYRFLDLLNSSHLDNLALGNNPWSCDCGAVNFTNFLRRHTKVDTKYILCANSNILLIDLNKNDLCHQRQGVYIVIGLLVVLLAVASLLVGYYRYQQTLKVWLFAHNMCLRWVTEEKLDKNKIYDAFISYSHKDEDFVVQNLLPVLEGGPNPYKLCLHYRNWVPGEFISTQVTNSVLESRRTLVILSPNFLESVWGKMEFRTAHTQAMTEGRARVIILLYGDVETDRLDEELKVYLKTNTYIKWGEQYFWNKLKYALPHSKCISNNNQKLANVMSVIDDKINLVASVTGSPGYTPPALSVDTEKHRLNFVSSDLDTPPAESESLLVSTCL